MNGERDGVGVEQTAKQKQARRRGSVRIIARDPFGQDETPDPFVERLDAALRKLARNEAAAARRAWASSRRQSPPRSEVVELRRRRPWTPRLADVTVPEDLRWVEHLLTEEDRRRLASLDHLVGIGDTTDRFGLSPATLRRTFPLFYALYRVYFRVQSQGQQHIPGEGRALLAANHGGLLPFDGAMGMMDILLHTDPPRLSRVMTEPRAGTLPFLSVFLARTGHVIENRENLSALLDEEQLVLLFPEGVNGACKTVSQRYRLQSFSKLLVEEALRSKAPIVPMAFIGSDDQTPVLYDIQPIAQWLGLPAFPITPTFPWLGPLGLLPYPVRYRIYYGEPLRFYERFGPGAAEDEKLVTYLSQQVRRAVQHLVDRNH